MKENKDEDLTAANVLQNKSSSTAANASAAGTAPYLLSSLRYWDVRISHTKKFMVAGHFVPSIRGSVLPFMSKKRRLTIEVYKQAPAEVPVNEHTSNSSQTKRLFGELLKGISSSSLLQIPTMGDNDLVALRILKPKREKGGTDGNDNDNDDDDDDGNWDSYSIGNMSMSTIGFGGGHEDKIDFESDNIRWKERFRCLIDTVELSEQKGRTCDMKMGSDSSMIQKTFTFESKLDLQTFSRVLNQVNQLREARGRRLANAYLDSQKKSSMESPTGLTFPFLKRKEEEVASLQDSSPIVDSEMYSDIITIGDSQEETVVAADSTISTRSQKESILPDIEDPIDNTIQILIEIVAAYNLPIADIMASDPYVKVFDGTTEIHKTDVIHNTLNPVWTISTKSLFLIKTTVHSFFAGSNFISFQIKDYDAFKKNNDLGRIDISKDTVLNGTGERVVFDILSQGKSKIRRKDAKNASTLALRFRPATEEDVSFMETMKNNGGEDRAAVYAAETFLPPRDHHVPMMKKMTRKGHKSSKEYRVKPFPNPSRKLETTWLTKKGIDLEASQPTKHWIESGTGSLGKVFVELLWCDNLPNLDFSVTGRDKTDSFGCLVFEDCIVNTDVISDCLSPRWMPWTQRAFIFNIMHPSSQLMVGIFDYDPGYMDAGHDFVGRAVINLTNLRPRTVYTQTYVLHETAKVGRVERGAVTVRIRVDIPEPRKLILAGVVPVLNHDVSVDEKEYFPVVHQTLTHGEQSSILSLESISSYVQELQSYLDLIFYIQPAIATVLLWRGHFPVSFRIPFPNFGQSRTKTCWDRCTRQVCVKLPLHSITFFLWGISLAWDFNLFPAFLVFSCSWFLLATMEFSQSRPFPHAQPQSYAEICGSLLFNWKLRPITIEPNASLSEILAYNKKQQEVKEAREEIIKTVQMEQKKYQAYIQEETSKLEKEVDITSKARGGLSSMTLAPFRGILLPLQQILHTICIILRVSKSIVVWRDSYISFWITTACFLATFILVWIPWGFIISWIFKISVWVFLGPWMKLVDIFYIGRHQNDPEKKKEDLAQQFHAQYSALIGESVARKLRKESALKTKDMKKYMFGKFLMRVPVFKEERFFDDPVPASFAEPFDSLAQGEINVVDRKFGQLLEGDMIPKRQIPIMENEKSSIRSNFGQKDTSFPSKGSSEVDSLLMKTVNEDYDSLDDSNSAKKPLKRLFFRK